MPRALRPTGQGAQTSTTVRGTHYNRTSVSLVVCGILAVFIGVFLAMIGRPNIYNNSESRIHSEDGRDQISVEGSGDGIQRHGDDTSSQDDGEHVWTDSSNGDTHTEIDKVVENNEETKTEVSEKDLQIDQDIKSGDRTDLKILDTPSTSDVGHIPVAAETPETPETPPAPETPEIPQASETPETPKTPKAPETPSLPGTPTDGQDLTYKPSPEIQEPHVRDEWGLGSGAKDKPCGRGCGPRDHLRDLLPEFGQMWGDIGLLSEELSHRPRKGKRGCKGKHGKHGKHGHKGKHHHHHGKHGRHRP